MNDKFNTADTHRLIRFVTLCSTNSFYCHMYIGMLPMHEKHNNKKCLCTFNIDSKTGQYVQYSQNN